MGKLDPTQVLTHNVIHNIVTKPNQETNCVDLHHLQIPELGYTQHC